MKRGVCRRGGRILKLTLTSSSFAPGVTLHGERAGKGSVLQGKAETQAWRLECFLRGREMGGSRFMRLLHRDHDAAQQAFQIRFSCDMPPTVINVTLML